MFRIRHIAVASLAALALTFPVAAAPKASEKKSDSEKVICKSIGETGSLVRKRKQCFTRAEWDRIAESQRTGTQKMVDQLTTRPSGQ